MYLEGLTARSPTLESGAMRAPLQGKAVIIRLAGGWRLSSYRSGAQTTWNILRRIIAVIGTPSIHKTSDLMLLSLIDNNLLLAI